MSGVRLFFVLLDVEFVCADGCLADILTCTRMAAFTAAKPSNVRQQSSPSGKWLYRFFYW